MSDENVEFLRKGYAALQHGNIDTFAELSRERLDPGFEFHHVWDGRVFRGFEGTMKWIADTRDTWEDYNQELDEIVELGEDVVVVVRISARGTGSGVPVAQELAVVWTFEGDKAIQARSFTSKAEALAAAGAQRGEQAHEGPGIGAPDVSGQVARGGRSPT
jgi:ketosteroid isomerase-like protein